MAGSVVTYSQNEGAWYIEAEIDLSAAGAITATRGTNITCTKTGTGQYTFVIKNTSALSMYEVLNRYADLGGNPAGAFWGKVRSVVQSATTGDITVVCETLSNAATPIAADVSAVCVLSMTLIVRTIRMGNPL